MNFFIVLLSIGTQISFIKLIENSNKKSDTFHQIFHNHAQGWPSTEING